MRKKGAIGHIEIIISFIIFVGFLIFLFYIFNPFKKSGVNTSMLNIVEESLRSTLEITTISTSIVLNTSAGSGYPGGFEPCFILGGANTSLTGNADAILITDVSDSMRDMLNSTLMGVDGVPRACDDPRLLENTTERMSLAKCLSKQFVNTILSVPGNKVGLVSYSTNLISNRSLTIDNNSLIAEINTYAPLARTCICCGINQAYTMLKDTFNASRKRFVVVMTDGQANRRCTSSSSSSPPSATCNVSGVIQLRQFNGTSTISTGCGLPQNCLTSDYDAPKNNTIWSANRTHVELDANISAIGMSVAGCQNAELTLAETARVGGGIYRAGNNGQTISDIYQTFAQNIIEGSFIDPLGESVPPNYKIAAQGGGGQLLEANNSDFVYVQFGGEFYDIYFSDSFDETGVMNPADCKNLAPSNYSLGLMQERVFIRKGGLEQLNASYHANYADLKNMLSIPEGLEFGFIVRDPQGNVLFQAINRKATKVHVRARDVPSEMIDANGRIRDIIINIQVW